MKLKNALMLGVAAALLGSATPATFAAGMVIPAYLTLDDATDWNILAEDASIMATGSSPTYKDYWVTVNSGSNGPFTNSADWATAKTRFDPIRTNGGKIFGYVHTLVSPSSDIFRSLSDVEADVTAWVNGYGSLDGIWIDEYNPRFELAPSSDATHSYPSPTYPNGVALAPTDRSFVDSNGNFNGQEVNPAGGYYSQLTGWIRSTYPQLKIIGNAGGHFYSNQHEYGNLVDVTCSFEQTYGVAANSPTNDWSGLNQDNGGLTYPQLAVIHSNSSDLNGAVDQSISHGYQYFYTTDRVYTPTSNLYGGLPSYFTSEVNYIANHG